MSLLWLIVIVLLIFALLGAPNIGPVTHSYGYYPSSLLTIVVVIIVVLILTGRL